MHSMNVSYFEVCGKHIQKTHDFISRRLQSHALVLGIRCNVGTVRTCIFNISHVIYYIFYDTVFIYSPCTKVRTRKGL